MQKLNDEFRKQMQEKDDRIAELETLAAALMEQNRLLRAIHAIHRMDPLDDYASVH